jgi:hypothetical protein
LPAIAGYVVFAAIVGMVCAIAIDRGRVIAGVASQGVSG